MATLNIKGVTVTVNGADEQGHNIGHQLIQIRRTLQRLPQAHIAVLPPITIGNRPTRGGGGYAHPGQYAAYPEGFIKLNYDVFDYTGIRSFNRGYSNLSLLHEVGHIVDWNFGCTASLSNRGRSILYDSNYEGNTHGAGEHFAQAYMRYFTVPSTISRTRQEVLLSTPAFEAALV